MYDFLKRCWAQVDLDALSHNAREIRARLQPKCLMMGVVKADAYGHGDQWCARELAQNGVDWFGVSNVEEALSLRLAGLDQPILVLGATPVEKAGVLAHNHITQTVFSAEYAQQLEGEAQRQQVQVDAHIKVDTGMGRLGFDGFDADCAEAVQTAALLPHLQCGGIFTHFSCADEDAPEACAYTHSQFKCFMAVLGDLEARGVTFAIRHCCNSAATLRFPDMHLDMVRPGLILYGLYPDPCCWCETRLRPVMQLRAMVSMVKTLPTGRSVSYGRTFTAAQETHVATVPIGYADGYPRALSGKGVMLVRGQRVPVIGRVCMDQLMLDVHDVEGICAGDEVVILGTQGMQTHTAEEMAQEAGTIHYEMVCMIGKRVPRLYLRDGTPCGVTSFSAED